MATAINAYHADDDRAGAGAGDRPSDPHSTPAHACTAKHAGQPESKRSERVLQRLSTLPPLNAH